MRYLVIERYVRGAGPVYARAAERGRKLPSGLVYLDSWVDAEALDRCFQLMETDDPSVFSEWTAHWEDIVEFGDRPGHRLVRGWRTSAPK